MAFTSPPVEGKPRKSAWKNQRASVRYRCAPATTGKVCLADDIEFLRAWVEDLSTAGVGLLLAKPLERGLFVNIQLQSALSKNTYHLPAHVAHSTQRATGEWLVGCEFVGRLSSDALDDLL